jgi:hypothetical protein
MVGVLNVDSLSIPIGGCLLNSPSEHMDNHKEISKGANMHIGVQIYVFDDHRAC